MSAPFADPVGAFVAHGRAEVAGAGAGLLAGLRFAVKDLFDVAGAPTGAGSPEWLASHPVPTTTAPAVERLLAAGATLVGKTHTDELAWSLNGENAHYGTPANVAAPGRVPGGSSSGSAAAVAAGLVDLALGSDTGGSVRLPASHCGLFGMRPTHGRVPLAGAVPLAPSLDTAGWFARDAATLARAGRALLDPPEGSPPGPPRLLMAEDLFALAGGAVRGALAPALARIAARFGPPAPVDLAGGAIGAWRDAFRVVQSAEAWATHGAWITATRPALGPGVRERFAAAAVLEPARVEAARATRREVRARLQELIGPRDVVLLPTVPGIAPLLRTPPEALEGYRAAALALLCPAGLAGLPQVSLPLGTLEGCPLGLSLLGARGTDEALLDLVAALAP